MRMEGTNKRLLSSGNFLHAIQSTAGLEPCNLKVIETVVELDLFGLSVGMFDFSCHLLAWCEAI